MPVRFSLLVLLLAVASGCASATESRLARLESTVENLQTQEIRLAILEDAMSTVLAGQAGSAQASIPPGSVAEPVSGREMAYAPRRIAPAPMPAAARAAAKAENVSQTSPPRKTAAAASPQAAKSYQVALSTLESGRPQAAMTLFTEFLRTYPDSGLAANAGYWLGECHYSLKQYDSAILAFKDVVAQHSRHSKAAAAMLKAGYSYAQLGDAANARFYLEALVRDYPDSEPASLARQRLAAL